jgi:CO/xanthine dehydrogenase FAD-binding subunit
MTQATEVLFPTSAEEAIAQFGDGGDVTVLGGGTIVMPELTYGRLAPSKVVSLA